YTRTNFPFFTWKREKHGVGVLAGMSLVPSRPSASNEGRLPAAVRKVARVSELAAPCSTIAVTTSRNKRATAQACTPLLSTLAAPTVFMYAFTAGEYLASSTGTNGRSTYWPSALAPAVLRNRLE